MKPARLEHAGKSAHNTGWRVFCLFRWLRPPRRWHVAVLVVSGAMCGMVLVVLRVSRAASYLTDDPAACVNCHVMGPQYASWQHSSHALVATCNDCHVPHDSVWRKYGFKAMDGARHSFMFTFKLEPQVIRIHEAGARVVQENCVRCHGGLFSGDAALAPHGGGRACIECHREVPHGRVNSLASSPDALVPRPAPTQLPEWLSTLPGIPPHPDTSPHNEGESP